MLRQAPEYTKNNRKVEYIKLFLVFVICVLGLYAAVHILTPVLYAIKEPNFIMPLRVGGEILTEEDLPLRNDDFGDGFFGAKRRGGRLHKGLDLFADYKSPVYASKSGMAEARFIPGGYGNLVVIDHPGKWQTRYGHLDSALIGKKKWVRQGDLIGYVGKTGNADVKGMVMHLHFEIRQEKEALDPAQFLVKNEK